MYLSTKQLRTRSQHSVSEDPAASAAALGGRSERRAGKHAQPHFRHSVHYAQTKEKKHARSGTAASMIRNAASVFFKNSLCMLLNYALQVIELRGQVTELTRLRFSKYPQDVCRVFSALE